MGPEGLMAIFYLPLAKIMELYTSMLQHISWKKCSNRMESMAREAKTLTLPQAEHSSMRSSWSCSMRSWKARNQMSILCSH